MTKRFSKGTAGKAAIAGAIGSAAVAAAVLYMNKRREKKQEPNQLPPIPSGEAPETD